jgi:hypothetical protein
VRGAAMAVEECVFCFCCCCCCLFWSKRRLEALLSMSLERQMEED